jgi:hypothetical protein
MKKLTIGLCCYDDFDGVFFSINAIRMYHPEVMDRVEFLIIDNNPTSESGKAVCQFSDWIKEAPVCYIGVKGPKGTALRDWIFRLSDTPYVLCMDCHVLLAPGSLSQLIDFFDSGADAGDLLQGPLLQDNLSEVHTHMDPVWRCGMWGTWGTDERGKDPKAEPFEIPMHGLGLFACRKAAWLGFNPKFSGFGGEEGYIHEKFRKAHRKTLCLPFLRWNHRFQRPLGIPYAPSYDDRILNYWIGHEELGLDTAVIREHFSSLLGKDRVDRVLEAVTIGEQPEKEVRV